MESVTIYFLFIKKMFALEDKIQCVLDSNLITFSETINYLQTYNDLIANTITYKVKF